MPSTYAHNAIGGETEKAKGTVKKKVKETKKVKRASNRKETKKVGKTSDRKKGKEGRQ